MSRYLVTGRIGTPTYWNLQYGISFLYGDLADIRGAQIFSPISISRWRVGLDGFYRYGTYLVAGAQAIYGQDGFAGDNQFVGITGGETADVLGFRAWADWVVPQHLDLRLGGQFESLIRDLGTADTDDTAVIFEVGYSLTTGISAMLDYRLELSRSMIGDEDHAIFLTLIYYSL
jgi:hypothetical protein